MQTSDSRIAIAKGWVTKHQTPEWHAAAVTGSTARGWASSSSDVDVLIFGDLADKPDITDTLDGVTLDVGFYDVGWTLSYLEADVVDLAKLRLASTLSEHVCLFDNTGILTRLGSYNAHLELDPAIAAAYSNYATRYLSSASLASSIVTEKFYTSRALQCFLVLTLSSSRFRVLKNKWTWRCLAEIDSALSRKVAYAFALEEFAALVRWTHVELALSFLHNERKIDNRLYKQFALALADGRHQETDASIPRESHLYLKECLLTHVLSAADSDLTKKRKQAHSLDSIQSVLDSFSSRLVVGDLAERVQALFSKAALIPDHS